MIGVQTLGDDHLDEIGKQDLWTFKDEGIQAECSSNYLVRKSRGHLVGNYEELARKVAELQFRNRDFVLLFRGQSEDFKDTKGGSTLLPTIFRKNRGLYDCLLFEYQATSLLPQDRSAFYSSIPDVSRYKLQPGYLA